MTKHKRFGRVALILGLGLFLLSLGVVYGLKSWVAREVLVVRMATDHYPVISEGVAEPESMSERTRAKSKKRTTALKKNSLPRQVRWSASKPKNWTALSSLPPGAVRAIVISEDWDFYNHQGYDFNQIKEALKTDLKRRELARGASTITQQVVKNLFLTQDKTLWRKLKEVALAIELEKTLSKQQILEIYLNIVELGPHLYGIHEASLKYFGKLPSVLTVTEGAFLAMLLPSPVRYSHSFRQKSLTPYAEQTIRSILEKLVSVHDPSVASYDPSEPLNMSFGYPSQDVQEPFEDATESYNVSPEGTNP